MPRLNSRYFGELDYTPDSVFEFVQSIPGFENRTAWVCVEQSQNDPLIFLQSVEDGGLTFICVPVFVADPGYRLSMAGEELEALGFSSGAAPQIGKDVLCLAPVTVSEGADPTVNLAAPFVLNLQNRRALQAIQTETSYSFQHPLLAGGGVSKCS